MTIEEKIIYDLKIRLAAFKEALTVVKQYSDKDFIIAALEGKIEGTETAIKDLGNVRNIH